MRRFIKKVHLWLAIPTGFIIFIICITGAILSFENEILEAYYPERYFIENTQGEKMPLGELIPIVNQQLDSNTVASIKITSDPQRTYTASLTKGFRVSAFVDPYTGEVKGIYEFREGFFFKMMTLHRWLMDGSRTWGKYTVGVTTILFVFILLSGIVWWIPNQKKKLKSRLTVKTTKGIKRFLYDAHLTLGIYACLFLLLCCLTGLMWSFGWYRTTVTKLFKVESSSKGGEEGGGNHGENEPKEKKSKTVDYNVWQQALDNIQSLRPDNNYVTISKASITLLPEDAPHKRATDKYKFDSQTGQIGKASLYSEQKGSSKVMTWAYALHVGDYGGIFTRILTCLACIIGASLPLTGYYLFYMKHLKKKKKKTKSVSTFS